MLRTTAEVIALFAVLAAFMLGLRWCGPGELDRQRAALEQHESDAGLSAARHTAADPSSLAAQDQGSPASVRPSLETNAAVEKPDDGEHASQPSPGGRLYGGTYTFEDMEGPKDGVLATTLDLWNSEAFKQLTLAEVRALLRSTDPLPGSTDSGTETALTEDGPWSAYDLSGDGLLLDRIGGLPTEEDVIDALDSPAVQEALYRYLVANGIRLEFEINGIRMQEERNPEERKKALAAMEAAQDGLYRALDEHSGYHHWALLGAIWRAFDRE